MKHKSVDISIFEDNFKIDKDKDNELTAKSKAQRKAILAYIAEKIQKA